MKKTGALILALLMVLSFSLPAVGEEIAPEELLNLWNQGLAYNLFDVREADQANESTVRGAENIPLDQWGGFLRQVLDSGFDQMDAPIYVFGADETQGKAAAETARLMGFTGVRYLSSFDEWTGAVICMNNLLGDLATVDIYGAPVDKSLIEGKKLVMVNVWGTYCGPCVNEMEGLGNLAREMEKDGVMILGLVIDCQNQDLTANEAQTEKARSIAEETKASYPHILPSAHMNEEWLDQITAVPTTFFLTGEGKMVGQRYIGARSEEEWKEIMLSALASIQE